MVGAGGSLVLAAQQVLTNSVLGSLSADSSGGSAGRKTQTLDSLPSLSIPSPLKAQTLDSLPPIPPMIFVYSIKLEI